MLSIDVRAEMNFTKLLWIIGHIVVASLIIAATLMFVYEVGGLALWLCVNAHYVIFDQGIPWFISGIIGGAALIKEIAHDVLTSLQLLPSCDCLERSSLAMRLVNTAEWMSRKGLLDAKRFHFTFDDDHHLTDGRLVDSEDFATVNRYYHLVLVLAFALAMLLVMQQCTIDNHLRTIKSYKATNSQKATRPNHFTLWMKRKSFTDDSRRLYVGMPLYCIDENNSEQLVGVIDACGNDLNGTILRIAATLHSSHAFFAQLFINGIIMHLNYHGDSVNTDFVKRIIICPCEHINCSLVVIAHMSTYYRGTNFHNLRHITVREE